MLSQSPFAMPTSTTPAATDAADSATVSATQSAIESAYGSASGSATESAAGGAAESATQSAAESTTGSTAGSTRAGASGSRILLVQGHPDANAPHLGHALADAYARGAAQAGHAVRRTEVARLDFALLRSAQDWEHGTLPASLAQAQQDLAWAQHVVIFFPLWLGDMPALLKGFLEQVARPGFAFQGDATDPFARKGLKGRSVRVVVTMGMPALVYRWFYRAHSVRSLERNILGFVGMGPIRETLIGMVGRFEAHPQKARRWIERMHALGAAGR